MERRKAIIAAATASLTLLAGGAAIGINTGIVSATGDDGVGRISPVEQVTTTDAPADPGQPVPSGSDLSAGGDDESRYEDESEHDDEHDDEGLDGTHDDDHELEGLEHEYEGADDDD
jgi:hypothetical protein